MKSDAGYGLFLLLYNVHKMPFKKMMKEITLMLDEFVCFQIGIKYFWLECLSIFQ